MKNNKRYIILIVLLIIFFLSLFFLVGKDNLKSRGEDLTLLVGEDVIWQRNSNSWNNNLNINSYNWEKFKIYLDNRYKGEYLVWHDDKYYIFDDNREAINYTEKFIGIQSNYDVNFLDYESKDIEVDSYITKVLTDHKLDESSELTLSTKTSVDLDKDGNDEDIYIVSNAFPIDFSPKKIFSFVFVVKDGQIYNVYESVEKNDYDNGVKPYIYSILDVDDDGTYEFIISYAEYSTNGSSYTLYKLDKNEITAIISNEENNDS